MRDQNDRGLAGLPERTPENSDPLPNPKLLALVAALFACFPVPAQDPEPADPDVIVVTATRTGRDPFDVPFTTGILPGSTVVGRQQARTTPEALRELAGISVQKTAHGQGSPKFRGQTGFQTLLLVDGIRINDSTWRSGNVEYWNHVDPYSFDRFEIVRGPSSVLWGSDAVSGVGQAIQKGNDSWEPGWHARGGALFRYASAEDAVVSRIESHGNAGEVFGWHAGITYKDYGDLKAGRDVGLLPETGYDEIDGDLKLTFRVSDHDTLSLGVQQNSLDDVPRTHSTVNNVSWRGITADTNLRREHDHRRQLYWLQWHSEEGHAYDELTGTVAIKSRHEREDRVRSNGNQDINELDVHTVALTAQLSSQIGDGTLTYGADWYHDFVDSEFRRYSPGGTLLTSRNRGSVAGDADYDLVGVFAQYELPVADSLDVVGGVRWNYARVDAKDVDVPGDSVVFDNVSDDWNAVTASLRALWKLADEVRVFGGFSQGFRAPNLADTTRFDVGRSGEQEVPATGLDPELYYTFEVGGRYDDGTVTGNATLWTTIARDQISRFRTGNTVGGLPEISKSNVGDGYYAGFELEGSVGLELLSESLDEWTAFGFFDWVTGKIDQVLASGQEIEDRPKALPPPTGMAGLRWLHPEQDRGVEVFTRMAYHVNPSRYTEADRNNTQRIPPGGLPGWATVNIRGWMDVTENLTVSLAVENLTDVDYRIMDSGLNEPGANVIMTVQADF